MIIVIMIPNICVIFSSRLVNIYIYTHTHTHTHTNNTCVKYIGLYMHLGRCCLPAGSRPDRGRTSRGLEALSSQTETRRASPRPGRGAVSSRGPSASWDRVAYWDRAAY